MGANMRLSRHGVLLLQHLTMSSIDTQQPTDLPQAVHDSHWHKDQHKHFVRA